MYSYGLPHMAEQKQDHQLEHTFSSYVRIRDVALKTYQRQWTIGRCGERGSKISVLAARHDDDDDISSSLKCYAVFGFTEQISFDNFLGKSREFTLFQTLTYSCHQLENPLLDGCNKIPDRKLSEVWYYLA